MKAHQASLINAVVLIVLGLWAYWGSENPSMTALIPVVVGAILLALNPGVKKEDKIRAHIAVVLTLIILFGLVKPLMGAVDRGSTIGILRVGVMMLSTVVAIIYFVKSFIDARKAREA